MDATEIQAYNRWQQEAAVSRWRMAKSLADKGMTYREIGEVMGISHARVGQMIKKLAELEHGAMSVPSNGEKREG